MLQMNCSNCSGLIKSPHLAEVQIFLCPQCGEIVVVEDVVISTEKNAFDLRPSLKKLLFAAREKFQRNKSENLELQTKYEINERLARLLRRDDFRLNLSRDFFVQIGSGKNKRSARLLNISSTGAAIEVFDLGQLPDKGSETRFQLQLPGQDDPHRFLQWLFGEANQKRSRLLQLLLWDYISRVWMKKHVHAYGILLLILKLQITDNG